MAERLRIAFFQTELSRDGPGLMLRDIASGDAQVQAVRRIVEAAGADVLVLGGIDHDHRALGLSALASGLAAAYPHRIGLPGNTGLPTGRDMNGDGRRGTPDDMQSWGRFAGQDGMAVLSRYPIRRNDVRSLNTLLWRDMPGSLLVDPAGRSGADATGADVQRLVSRGHWIVPVRLDDGKELTLIVFQCAAPVFDGPEDRNGRRNHDQLRLLRMHVDGELDLAAPTGAFVLIGGANLDPSDGEGRRAAIRSLLSDPRVIDPKPASQGGRAAANEGQTGSPARDTADWTDPDPGNLRVDYVLPSSDMSVRGAGVLWPAPGEPLAEAAAAASRHRLVWVDIEISDAR